MKPTILKVYSNYPDFDLKKNDKNHLIKISNVENSNSPQIKCELLSNAFCENTYSNDDTINESNRDISVLEDYYRFQERRNAFMDSKKSLTHNNQSQLKRVYERPNFSYTQLIYMAIESSALKSLTVNDIYTWCELNFPYYANAIHGWKNSLRHNLSINKCFKKITKMGQGGRGSLWIVDPREKQHLVSTMHRSNITSFSSPSFIIQATPQTVESSRVTMLEDPVMEIPQDDTVIITGDSVSCQWSNESFVLPEDKPSYTWTDTRLPSDFTIALTPENCSDTSDTDFNDWKRAVVSLEPIFPVKQHLCGPLHPVITPPSSLEHNYSIPNLQTVFDDPYSIVRHLFQTSGGSNVSYCTSSDYNDEEWPRTPSPVPQVTTSLQSLSVKPKPIKTGLKRGRPKNSTKQKQLNDITQKSVKKINRVDRINNMYKLNNFINSL